VHVCGAQPSPTVASTTTASTFAASQSSASTAFVGVLHQPWTDGGAVYCSCGPVWCGHGADGRGLCLGTDGH
jgi:hypothetical protein